MAIIIFSSEKQSEKKKTFDKYCSRLWKITMWKAAYDKKTKRPKDVQITKIS